MLAIIAEFERDILTERIQNNFDGACKGWTVARRLVNLIATVVERICITTENGKHVCHIFVKGCTTEDYTDLFGGTTDYT